MAWVSRKQKQCMHHDRITGVSWTVSRLINLGTQKMIWCTMCEQMWFA